MAQQFGQAKAAPRRSALDRPLGNTQTLRGLCDAEALDVERDHDGALLCRKLGERGPDTHRQFHRSITILAAGHRRDIELGQRNRGTQLISPDSIEAGVHDDAV